MKYALDKMDLRELPIWLRSYGSVAENLHKLRHPVIKGDSDDTAGVIDDHPSIPPFS